MVLRREEASDRTVHDVVFKIQPAEEALRIKNKLVSLLKRSSAHTTDETLHMVNEVTLFSSLLVIVACFSLDGVDLFFEILVFELHHQVLRLHHLVATNAPHCIEPAGLGAAVIMSLMMKEKNKCE